NYSGSPVCTYATLIRSDERRVQRRSNVLNHAVLQSRVQGDHSLPGELVAETGQRLKRLHRGRQERNLTELSVNLGDLLVFTVPRRRIHPGKRRDTHRRAVSVEHARRGRQENRSGLQRLNQDLLNLLGGQLICTRSRSSHDVIYSLS